MESKELNIVEQAIILFFIFVARYAESFLAMAVLMFVLCKIFAVPVLINIGIVYVALAIFAFSLRIMYKYGTYRAYKVIDIFASCNPNQEKVKI